MTEKSTLTGGDSEAKPLALTIDWDVYADALGDSELSDTEKRELLETLWSIVVSFVDLGFDIHPIQQSTKESFNLTSFLEGVVMEAAKQDADQKPSETVSTKSERLVP